MLRLLTTYAIGLVFGTGIAISGMANPAKVLNFFDVAGTWDPSLAFVMGGALAVTFVGYLLVFRRRAPLLGRTFFVPSKGRIDRRLLGGSAIFGLGWGLAGFCPGGALPALGTGVSEVFLFTGALIAGMLGTRAVLKRRAAPRSPAVPA